MKLTKSYKLAELTADELAHIARHLAQGALAVLATDTVYGLGTGAFCEGTIARICALKKRPLSQPMQLLVPSVAAAEKLAVLPDPARRLAQMYWPGALTLILPPKWSFKLMEYERWIALGVLILLYIGVLDGPLSFLVNGLLSGMDFLISLIPFL